MIRLWLAFLFLVAATSAHAGPVAVTAAGRLEGVRDHGVSVFRGTPYAAPPLGDLRWRAPQPATAWTGTRDVTRFAPACMQSGVSMPGETPPAVSEDCLYVNVWTPGTTGKRPVMVWIHGGGFTNGSAAMPLYWGDALAKRGIVVVTLAYRLGALGFLAHPGLKAEGGDTGNYGLMDQVAALHWVRDNIAAFGGDPDRVTIAGQSAGAMSVSLLMATPQARGLFRGAIAQSGGMFEPLNLAPGYRLEAALSDGEAYAKSLGAVDVDALRKLPAETLLTGNAVSHPVFGGVFLPQTPYDAYVSDAVPRVPVLMGWNAEEARSLTHVDTITAAGFADDLKRAFGPLPPSIFSAYPHATDEEAKTARLDLERDLRFGWDMWAWARLQTRQGGAAYVYSFDHRPPFPATSPYAGWGASHFAELWYMSGHLSQAEFDWRPRDYALEDDMTSYWLAFIKTGNPNGQRKALWRDFGADGQVLHFGSETQMGPVPGLTGLEAFDAAYAGVRGVPFQELSPAN